MRETKRHKAAERARYFIIANKVFDDFLYTSDKLEEFVERARKYKGVIFRQMRHLDLTDYYYKSKWRDTRSGHETYGYKSREEIEGQLEYISDRFNAVFRLRWLLDLLEIDLSKVPAETPEKE